MKAVSVCASGTGTQRHAPGGPGAPVGALVGALGPKAAPAGWPAPPGVPSFQIARG